jgi:hypothetical protein
MNRVEKNKLIAEFTGAVQSYKPYAPNEDMEFHMYGVIECIEDGPDEQHYFLPDDMQFDTDWNWLMSVVARIRVIDNSSTGEFRTSLLHFKRNNKNIFDASILEGQEYVYQLVVEFIEWYNQNK